MAEAILQLVGKGKFNAYSAGSDPARRADAGGDRQAADARPRRLADCAASRGTSSPAPTHRAWISSSRSATCCRASECPDFGDRPVTGAWPLPDPAKFTGSAVERATMINELYGMIRRRLEIFVNLPYASLDRMALKKRLDETRRLGTGPGVTERAMRVGINGMGRMGRLALRAAFGGVHRPGDDPRRGNRLDIVHVNEIKGGAAATAHLLEFDSIARPLAHRHRSRRRARHRSRRQVHRLQRGRLSG